MTNDQILATLNPAAAEAARDFLAKFPDAVLTSGRRDAASQAHAMATDVVKDRNFVAKTYKHPLCQGTQACQDWVDTWIGGLANLPTDQAVANIAGAFLQIFQGLPDTELEKVSCHLGGNAWDIQPDGDPAKITFLVGLAMARNASGGVAKFLSQESDLVRWHFQCV